MRATRALSGRRACYDAGDGHLPRPRCHWHARSRDPSRPWADGRRDGLGVHRLCDGSAITGPVIARFYDVPDGAKASPIRLTSQGTAQPYRPADLEQPDVRLTWHTRETYSGGQDAARPVARGDWAFANCESTPWPGTPDPTRICLEDGFRAGRFYDLVYTARDPLVLRVGLAATRDIVSFFRHAQTDGRARSPAEHAANRIGGVFSGEVRGEHTGVALDILRRHAVPPAIFVKHKLVTPENVDSLYPNDRLIETSGAFA